MAPTLDVYFPGHATVWNTTWTSTYLPGSQEVVGTSPITSTAYEQFTSHLVEIQILAF